MTIKNKYLVIFVVAVLVRLGLAIIFYNISPEWPSGSSKEYRIELAKSLAHGKGFSYEGIPNLYQTPVYPFFLALVFLFLGNNWWSIAIFQSIMEGLSCIGISKIGNHFSNYGWLAGFIYGLYPLAAMQSRSVIDTALFVMLFVFALIYYIEFISTYKIIHLFFASFCLGIAVLDRPSIFILWPAFVILMLSKGLNCRKILIYGSISLFITAIFPGFWALRNYEISTRFPVFSVGGQHFIWYGNNEHIFNILKNRESPDLVGRDPRYPMTPNFRVIDFFIVPPDRQVELGARCSEIAMKWILDNKSLFLKYTLLKLKRFLSWEYDIQDAANPFQKMRVFVYRITTAPIIIFGWLGLILLFFRKKDLAFFLLTIIIGFIFIHIITNFESRHKIPLYALLITTIPLTIQCLCSKFKKFIYTLIFPGVIR